MRDVHTPACAGLAFNSRRSLTRIDWKRDGSITNGHHGRPSALAGGVVGAETTKSVDQNTTHTHLPGFDHQQRSYGDKNGSFHQGVKRLGVRGGREQAAGWERGVGVPQ